MNKVLKNVACFCLLSLFVLSSSFAQYQESTAPYDVPVMVADQRSEAILNASGTVYVITADEIKRYGFRDLKDILAAIPSMELAWNYGELAGGMRGFSGALNNIRLLIDGRQMHSLLTDEAFIANNFPAHKIKRVEVLASANPVIYGPNSSEGVINIVTKVGSQHEMNASELGIAIGEERTSEFTGLLKRKSDDWEIGLSGSRFSSRQAWKEVAEFAADDTNFSRGQVAKNLMRQKDTSDFRNSEKNYTSDFYARRGNFYAGFNYYKLRSNDGLQMVKYDYSGVKTSRTLFLGYLGLEHVVSDMLKASVEYQRYLEKNSWEMRNYVSGTTIDDLDLDLRGDKVDESRKYSLLGKIDYEPNNRSVITVGAQWASKRVDDYLSQVNTLYPSVIALGWRSDRRSIDTSSIYAVDKITLIEDLLRFDAGLRLDRQDYAKNSNSQRLGFVYTPTMDSAVRLSYNRGVDTPDVIDFAGTTFDKILIGTQKTYELNYTQKISIEELALFNSCSIFQTQKSGYFKRVYNGAGQGGYIEDYTTTYVNKHQVKGIEELIKADLNKFSGFLGLRYLNPDTQVVSGEKRVMNIAPIKAKYGLSYQLLDKLNMAAFIDYWSKTRVMVPTEDGTATQEYVIGNFAVLNLNFNLGEFQIKDNAAAMVGLYVENALDEAYYHVNTKGTGAPIQWRQPPRTFRLKTTVDF